MSAFTDLIGDPDFGVGSRRVARAARRVPHPVPGFAAVDCRIGPGRVMDFALAGFALTHAPGALRRLGSTAAS